MPAQDSLAEIGFVPSCDGDDPPHSACGASVGALPAEYAADAPCETPREGASGPEGALLDGRGEPCPAPLAWQQVLAEFREQAAPFEVRHNGKPLHGRTLGSGAPLYFLNGLGGTHELFVLAVWMLRDEFRCVAFDYPPHGGASFDDLARALTAVADDQGDDCFSVYAASFGAAIALAAMAGAPGRIERAVLQGGFARVRLSPFERLAIRMARWMPGRLKHVPGRRAIQGQSHAPWFPPFDQTRWEFFEENTGSVPIAALASRAALLRRLDLRPRLASISTPVLLLRSEGEGRVSAAAGEEIQAALPAARSESLFGCGHLPYLTHPHRLVKLIRPFLRGEGVGGEGESNAKPQATG